MMCDVCGLMEAKPMYVGRLFSGERIKIGETCSPPGCGVIRWLMSIDETDDDKQDSEDMRQERVEFLMERMRGER